MDHADGQEVSRPCARIESREDADYLLIDGLTPAAVTDLIGTMANEKAEGKPILARNHNRYSDVRRGRSRPIAAA